VTTKPDLFRLLPSIDELLRDDAVQPVAQRFRSRGDARSVARFPR
jgi:hypothetical protein